MLGWLYKKIGFVGAEVQPRDRGENEIARSENEVERAGFTRSRVCNLRQRAGGDAGF